MLTSDLEEKTIYRGISLFVCNIMLKDTICQSVVYHHTEWFFKKQIFCGEILRCTCYCSRCFSNTRVLPMQNERVFCCYCGGRDDGFGRTVETLHVCKYIQFGEVKILSSGKWLLLTFLLQFQLQRK